jgi:hypothetical protein
VWIGHGAVVLPGVPARRLRDRFTPEIVTALLELAWWTWDHERLREALPDFRALSVEAFLARYAPKG